MATVDQIKDNLIEKISSINNREVWEALDNFISNTSKDSDVVKLTEAQKKMLQLSEEDIRNGQLISQDAMIKKNLKWLRDG